MERRIALQLAFLRKFPFVSDQGCQCRALTCFKCKRKGHHVGKTCTEIQQEELQCVVQYCPACKIATIKTEGCNSIICVCGNYWEWDASKGSASEAPRQYDYDPCWGGRTWCFLEGGRRKQVQYVSVGEKVLTAQGTYRAVSRIWYQDLKSRFSRDVEVVNFRGMWITSHHPVLVGNDWRFPAELSASYPAWRMADTIGAMYNFELEGHNDTIALCGEDGKDRPIISCTIGKYLGRRFGYTVFTRRSTRCPEDCDQCDSVQYPGIDFGRLSHGLRWRQFPEFKALEWQGLLDWGGDEGAELRFKQYLLANPIMKIEEVETEEQERERVILSRHLPSVPSRTEGGRLGVTIGKFFPPHRGHEALFNAALEECDHLVILVGDRPGQEVRGQVVARWVAAVCPQAEVICVVDDLPMDSAPWAARTLLVLDGRKPSVVITGEAYGETWAQMMGCRHHHIGRIPPPLVKEDISEVCKFHFNSLRDDSASVNATDLRHDMFGAWDMLSGPAKGHFCYRVVVTGAESTGSTTLAEALAAHYKTPCVPEYGREYWANHGEDAPWSSSEFTTIVDRHLAVEDNLATKANRVLICDTQDPLSTHLWHRSYCGTDPEPSLAKRADKRYDLYLLTCPDFPFVQDGTRNESRRELMHTWFEEYLATLETDHPVTKLRTRLHQRPVDPAETRPARVILLRGSHESRMAEAIAAIDDLVKFPQIHLPADLAVEVPEGGTVM